VYLEICGYEIISPIVPGELFFNQGDLTDALVAGDAIFVEFENLFDNSSPENFCPIVKYSLVSGENSLEPMNVEFYEWITVNDTHFSINEYAPFLTFAVMAETAN